MTINTLCVFGTRPEAIKMAPVIQQLQSHPLICNKVCMTGQHQHMIESVLNLFDIKPDFNLQVMSTNQHLSHLTAKILENIEDVLHQYRPDWMLVQGDTTTTLAASLAAFYHRIPVAHIEAGLRTGNLYSPWPEEANRKITSTLARLHFAPTEWARDNLRREGIDADTIHLTGNTGIDALHIMIDKLKDLDQCNRIQNQFPFLSSTRKMILVTGHRRENFGAGFQRICQALLTIARLFPTVDIVYPVHLNPNVQQPVQSLLANVNNIYLLKPVDYLSFVYLMQSAHLILTDSGGIQEEAPSLGKTVLVMRDTTERPEAMTTGTTTLIGTDVDEIVRHVATQLESDARPPMKQNPYGDGLASTRIVKIIAACEKMCVQENVHATVP